MSGEEKAVETVALSEDAIRQGLAVIGKHPILLNHAFLELKVVDSGVSDISALAAHPSLMYVNLSHNKIADIKALEALPALVQLNLAHNALIKCLDFAPLRCSKDNAWAQGDTAIGSMLSSADLSHNSLQQLDSLAHHPYLEVLLLSHNCIREIGSGLASLKFLNVLDLSHNNLTAIGGLDGLQLRELNLSHNRITDLSGLAQCAKLSSLNVSSNLLQSLSPLRECASLMCLDAGSNNIAYVRQTDFLVGLQWLSTVVLTGNPCSKKRLYRRRVIHRLARLFKLDESDVTAEEQIETANMYGSELSDAEGRANIFYKHFPHDQFDSPALFQDDELSLTMEQLLETAPPQAAVAAE
jgi:hypothetical protein